MATLEDVKEKLTEARAQIAAAPNAWPTTAPLAAIDAALELLHQIEEPGELRKQIAFHVERRKGARRRAKLDAAHGIMSMMTGMRSKTGVETTWRDGHVAGLDAAHKHVNALSVDDPDD